MMRAEKILQECGSDLNNINRKLQKLGHYFIFYTHTYEQINEVGKNVLSIPGGTKFDEAEFYGLALDMIRDFADNKGIEFKNNKLFKAFINTLKELERNGDVE